MSRRAWREDPDVYAEDDNLAGWVAFGVLVVALAAILCGLSGCGPKRSSDPYTAATGAGATRIVTAADSAQWSNDQVIRRTEGETRSLARSTAHSLEQVQDGASEVLRANKQAADHLRAVEADRDAAQAKAKAYDESWTGGVPRRIWARVKFTFWAIVAALAADWIVAKVFSASPIGAVAGGIWRAVAAAFVALIGLFRRQPPPTAQGA